jgi:hypothetical protein
LALGVGVGDVAEHRAAQFGFPEFLDRPWRQLEHFYGAWQAEGAVRQLALTVPMVGSLACPAMPET